MTESPTTVWYRATSLSVMLNTITQSQRLRILLWLLAGVLGGVPIWAAVARSSMNPDGIAYLDMGDAYLRGDWGMAINGYWSPLYSWLLAVPLHVLRVPPALEFPAVQLVNFVIYLAALTCFDFFWRVLLDYSRGHMASGDRAMLPEWAWLALGYSLFIWSSLSLIEVWSVTPDMAVAAFVYLVSGIIVRIRQGGGSWYVFVLLGALLGLGYLTKAPMFPLAFVFLGVAFFAVGHLRRALPRVAVALTVFLLLGSPLIVALSITKGRLTLGDSGKLNYARYVNRLPEVHWRGEPPGSGAAAHPTRKIFEEPPAYAFATPIGGTYPPWYDQSYWYEGVAIHFNLREQLAVLLSSAIAYYDLFFRIQAGLMASALILYLVSCRRWSCVKPLAQNWIVLVPALAAFAMYALVLPEPRYLGPFVVLFWAGVLAGIRLPASEKSARLAWAASLAMLLFVYVNIGAFYLDGLKSFTAKQTSAPVSQLGTVNQTTSGSHWEVASGLSAIGIRPGDRVAFVGYSFDAFWARLARVQIIAETQDVAMFWAVDRSVRAEIIKAFAATGARAIIAENVPANISADGWRRIGNTPYFVYLLSEVES